VIGFPAYLLRPAGPGGTGSSQHRDSCSRTREPEVRALSPGARATCRPRCGSPLAAPRPTRTATKGKAAPLCVWRQNPLHKCAIRDVVPQAGRDGWPEKEITGGHVGHPALSARGHEGRDVRIGVTYAIDEGVGPNRHIDTDLFKARNAAEPFSNRCGTRFQYRTKRIGERGQANLCRNAPRMSAEEVEEAVGDSTLGDELDADAGFKEDMHRSIGFFQHGIDRLECVAGWTEVHRRRPAALASQFLLDPRCGVPIHEDGTFARILRVTPSVAVNAAVRAAGRNVDRRHARQARPPGTPGPTASAPPRAAR